MTAAQVLRETRAKIRLGWTQRAWALDSRGRPLSLGDAEAGKAACWSLDGALLVTVASHQAQTGLMGQCMDLLEFGLPSRGRRAGVGLMSWNDTEERTQADVLELLDGAIRIVEGAA